MSTPSDPHPPGFRHEESHIPAGVTRPEHGHRSGAEPAHRPRRRLSQRDLVALSLLLRPERPSPPTARG